MATVTEIQIARDQYDARSAQAQLEAEVHRQGQLKAQLAESIAKQRELEQHYHRRMAERGRDMAMEKLRFAEGDLQENKIKLLLQAFDAILSIFNHVEKLAALLLGFVEKALDSIDVTNCPTSTKHLLWGGATVTAVVIIHAVYQSTLASVDATNLAYQGTGGIRDVIRAFHGLMRLRSRVFWNFMLGVSMFLVLALGAIWIHLQNDEENSKEGVDEEDYIFALAVSIGLWFLPLVWLSITWCRVRNIFRMDRSRLLEGARRGVIDDFEVALGPQSVRRKLQRETSPSADGSTPRSAGAKPTPWTQLWSDNESRYNQNQSLAADAIAPQKFVPPPSPQRRSQQEREPLLNNY